MRLWQHRQHWEFNNSGIISSLVLVFSLDKKNAPNLSSKAYSESLKIFSGVSLEVGLGGTITVSFLKGDGWTTLLLVKCQSPVCTVLCVKPKTPILWRSIRCLHCHKKKTKKTNIG